MKKFFLLALVAFALVISAPPKAEAGVHFDVSVGVPGFYGPGYYGGGYYGANYYQPYYYRHYYHRGYRPYYYGRSHRGHRGYYSRGHGRYRDYNHHR